MIEKRKQELQDRYDDAAFALLMDEYAEEEGARLLAEFEKAISEGDVPEVPESLDQKCRQIIHQNYAKQRRKERTKKVLQWTRKAAIVVFVFLGLSLTTVLSVDALRIPFLNYFIRHSDQSSVINFADQTPPTLDSENSDPLNGLLPDDYSRIDYENNDGLIYSVYTNTSGNYAMFDMCPSSGEYYFDTEDAAYEHAHLLGFDALYRREDELQMIWIDEEMQIVYSFSATNMTESHFKEICESLAQQFM